MQIIQIVNQQEVWDHWDKVEELTPGINHRTILREKIPVDMTWYIARIEENDLDNLYNIAAPDWQDISNNTFLVRETANHVNLFDINTSNITIIRNRIDNIRNGFIPDTMLIAITKSSNFNCPITIIEGNKRSVAFYCLGSLIGIEIFIGISPEVPNYTWAVDKFIQQ